MDVRPMGKHFLKGFDYVHWLLLVDELAGEQKDRRVRWNLPNGALLLTINLGGQRAEPFVIHKMPDGKKLRGVCAVEFVEFFVQLADCQIAVKARNPPAENHTLGNPRAPRPATMH